MTKAETTEFEATLNSVKEMKRLSTEINRPYHDKNIAKFAEDAIKEHDEVSAYLKEKISEDPSLLLNLDDISMVGDVFHLTPTTTYLTAVKNLYIYFTIPDLSRVKKAWGYCTIRHISVESKGISIKEVTCEGNQYPRKYDTLLYKGSQINLGGMYSATDWRSIHRLSELTREYTKCLWEAAKEALQSRISLYKDSAVKAENALVGNKNVGKYQKVASI